MKIAYKTKYGKCYQGKIEDALQSPILKRYKNSVDLIFTSPPFPLNRKKKYGNLNGQEYIDWISDITTRFRDLLTNKGSLVIEIGNSWDANEPVMSTLPLKALLAILEKGNFKLCQQFIWFNSAKLPSPAQWVNVDRVRVKDSFTQIWWMSKTSRPKADNKKVLKEYSDSMRRLIKTQKYNAGLRPSEHLIGSESFLKDNQGAIPSNVIVGANTQSNSNYQLFCKEKKIDPHPARMPLYIAEFFIKFLTDEKDLILDPFGGSMTTGEAAESLSRKWIAIEPNKEYILGSKGRFK